MIISVDMKHEACKLQACWKGSRLPAFSQPPMTLPTPCLLSHPTSFFNAALEGTRDETNAPSTGILKPFALCTFNASFDSFSHLQHCNTSACFYYLFYILLPVCAF